MRAVLGFISLVGLLVACAVSQAADKKQPEAYSADRSLVLGDSYALRVERHGTGQTVQGVLVKANDQWLVIRQIRTGVQVAGGVPILADLPIVGSAFRTTKNFESDEFLWIPREAASVEKRLPATAAVQHPSPATNAPPEKTACAIEVAMGDKIVRRTGGLEAVTAAQLTVSVPKQVTVKKDLAPFELLSFSSKSSKSIETHYERIQVARGDILYVRMANFESAAIKAQSQ